MCVEQYTNLQNDINKWSMISYWLITGGLMMCCILSYSISQRRLEIGKENRLERFLRKIGRWIRIFAMGWS